MENCELINLKEWSILGDLFNKIPSRIQKGLFSCDLNITCIDALSEFIAIGTDAGIVLWYNRKTGNLQKLKCETSSANSCVKIVSSVEYMVAAGCVSGDVSVFQIQKEHPPDLNLEPLTKPKPTERYTIRDLHKSSVKCVEWSKNGMKLFSGDKQGIIVLTEFDYQMHISKSIEILNEAYDIVQIVFLQPRLLISTIYRAIICERDLHGKWKVSQIGKKDRRMLSNFGAAFSGSSRNPTVICTRPGFRFWAADVNGNVSQTLLFKDALSKTAREVLLLNPGRIPIRLPMNFGKVIIYKEKFILTWSENIVYILNMETLTVEATIKRLRGIIEISVLESEIFILEGPRSLIRVSTNPDILNYQSNTIIFNPSMQILNENQIAPSDTPIEIEVDEDAVINAEECFELPEIKALDLDIPIEIPINEKIKEDQLISEQNKKFAVYDKINSLKFDDSILFKSGIHNKKHINEIQPKITKAKKKKTHGIVEIAKQAMINGEDEVDNKIAEKKNKLQCNSNNIDGVLATKPCLLNIKFCESASCIPDLRSPETINKDIEIKEKKLAETLNILPVHLEKIDTPIKTPDKMFPKWNFPITNICPDAPHTTPLKKLHFINDESPTSDDKIKDKMNNLCDDIKNIMIKSDITGYNTTFHNLDYNLPSTSSSLYVNKSPDFIPDLKKMPDYMNIPNLWNVTIEKSSELDDMENKHRKTSDPQSDSSDWEFVEI